MTFVKGKSGNPGGRPKNEVDIVALARKHSKEALTEVVRLMQASKDERIRMLAAQCILDRAWGKPAQAIAVTGADGGPIDMRFVDGPPQESRDVWIARKELERIEHTTQ